MQTVKEKNDHFDKIQVKIAHQREHKVRAVCTKGYYVHSSFCPQYRL